MLGGVGRGGVAGGLKEVMRGQRGPRGPPGLHRYIAQPLNQGDNFKEVVNCVSDSEYSDFQRKPPASALPASEEKL